MKIKKSRTKTHKRLLFPILLIVLLLAITLFAAYTFKMWPFESDTIEDSSSAPTITQEEREEIESNNASQKQEFLDKQVEKDKDNQTAASDEDTTTNSNNNRPAIDLSAKTEDGQLVITTDLSTTTTGECALELRKGQDVVTKTADVIFAPRSSTCAGFSINTSELSSGTWKISLTLKTNGETIKKSINHTL